ncbi:MAG: c-type cytochrome [Algoriphagus sp.]|uniref:c-type cytochrome n=1 Tax=Algoriphagus sp. TaxID=1872435 RepID=UPI0017F1BD5B|nr:c-type cytochrome [Algoriphagus sp.]NVJ84735.1 c-type cytochrome [Algoriphagus sp.]
MNQILLTVLIFLSFSWRAEEKKHQVTVQPTISQGLALQEGGLVLLEKHCYTCHNPKSKSHDEIIAPPLWGVKNHYLKAYPEKESFTKAVTNFVQNPNEEKALMKGPIKRFGLMPKPMISDSDLEKIVNFIYENEIENPAWHIEKDNHKNGSESPRE